MDKRRSKRADARLGVGGHAMTRRTFMCASGIVALGAAGAFVGCSASGPMPGALDPRVLAESASDIPATASEQTGLTAENLAREARVLEQLRNLSLSQKVAQLFIVRPEDLTGEETVWEAGEALRAAFAEHPVGGIVYFQKNLNDPDQTTALLDTTAQYAIEAVGLPAFLCIDEEGGTVARIGRNPAFDVVDVGNMADIGTTGDVEAAREAATAIAGYLTPLGFNVNFAPSADVAGNPESDVMALRSFGADPQLVASMVRAQIEAFAAAGLCCSAKHFPGIGAAGGDSHEVSIYSHRTLDELASCELVPFQAAIEAKVPFVMVGHLSTPEATGDDTPASLNPAMVQGVLRERMGFEGVVVTDSLGMGAVNERYEPAEAAVRALEAGCDIALLPADFGEAYNGVLAAIAAGRLTEERIDESMKRILRVKLSLTG